MNLSTIQKREKLNIVSRVDEVGPGNAHHEYMIETTKGMALQGIVFQKGPRNEITSVEGVIDSDLLEIVRDRLKGFQDGPYACRENAIVLTHIEEALMWLNRRVEDRIERNVLGKNER